MRMYIGCGGQVEGRGLGGLQAGVPAHQLVLVGLGLLLLLGLGLVHVSLYFYGNSGIALINLI